MNALVVFNDPNIGTYHIPVSSYLSLPIPSADVQSAKRAYLHLLLNPPVSFPPPAQIKPYDRPDAAAIIAQLTARAMGHRSSASAMQSISGLPAETGISVAGSTPGHSRGLSFSNPNANGANLAGGAAGAASGAGAGAGAGSQPSGGMGGFVMPTKRHSRNGSASSSWARTSMGGGVLNFPSSKSSGRLPTHSETTPSTSGDPSRVSSSSEDDPVVIIDGGRPAGAGAGRRDSLSAEKALREVQKAMASVEAK